VASQCPLGILYGGAVMNNPDREFLRTRKRLLICSIERNRRIIGMEREVQRLKAELAEVDRKLDAFKIENEWKMA
jgi:hypothetical protein